MLILTKSNAYSAHCQQMNQLSLTVSQSNENEIRQTNDVESYKNTFK